MPTIWSSFVRPTRKPNRPLPIYRPGSAHRGLTLADDKTRIVHLTAGFDFLGFNVRLYPTPTAKAGAKLFIKPSPAAVKRLRTRLRHEWHLLAGTNARAVLHCLSPIITGWANYYKPGVSAKTFVSLDHYMTQCAWRFAKRTHPRKRAQWRFDTYFGRRNPRRSDRWVFGDTASGSYLPKFAWTWIQRHIMVKGDASPDDAGLATYWQHRTHQTTTRTLPPRYHWLAAQQHYQCPVCGAALGNDEPS